MPPGFSEFLINIYYGMNTLRKSIKASFIQNSIHRPTLSWSQAVAWLGAFIPLQIEMTFIQCYHRFYSRGSVNLSSNSDILYTQLFIANSLNLLNFNKTLYLLHVYHRLVTQLFKILWFRKITTVYKIIISTQFFYNTIQNN